MDNRVKIVFEILIGVAIFFMSLFGCAFAFSSPGEGIYWGYLAGGSGAFLMLLLLGLILVKLFSELELDQSIAVGASIIMFIAFGLIQTLWPEIACVWKIGLLLLAVILGYFGVRVRR